MNLYDALWTLRRQYPTGCWVLCNVQGALHWGIVASTSSSGRHTLVNFTQGSISSDKDKTYLLWLQNQQILTCLPLGETPRGAMHVR